ncbi:cysteine hydrolase family protein [Youngiibacter fragilis]|uniref:nicotinamidase n=1 Tax=Youngiibacter fragilis 232.1 TaxID=994573 RepID=V7I2N4_9CLOT|nr:isochorismatase family cysteine hydrolase [Youngiibacter fragilis]ETA79546.1 amidase [Youngiibacter fragilis 232.1]
MRKVLVVVDMQKDFIDGSLGTSEAVEIVPVVVKKISNWDGDVVFTRDTHREEYLQTNEGGNLPVMHCISGTPGWEIDKTVLEAADGEKRIYDKDTFGSKELAMDLMNVGADVIELVGLCTDICVISNALLIKAFLPEAKIRVDASCCAGVSPESHRNALEAMKVCQVEILNE